MFENAMWLMVVAGGPLLLAVLLAWCCLRGAAAGRPSAVSRTVRRGRSTETRADRYPFLREVR